MADLSSISTEELMKMRGAPAGGSGADLSKMSTEELMRLRTGKPEEKSLARQAFEFAAFPTETALALGTGAIGHLVGRGTAVAQGLFGGKVGTQEGAREAQETGGRVAEALTYQPRGEPAQEVLRTIGSLLDKSKLAGMGPPEQMMAGGLLVNQPGAKSYRGTKADWFANEAPNNAVSQALPAIEQPFVKAKNTVGGMLSKAEPQMAGVGAAETAAEAMRRTRAESLPVPVKLSKGEASRDFSQQRFERETAKEGSEAGKLLRQHSSEEGQNIIKNLEWMMDETGAQAPSLRVSGGIVDDALRSRSNFMKGKYQDAYKRADAAGETAQLVDTRPLLQFLSENTSSKKLAGVIDAVENEVVRLGGGDKAGPGIIFPEQMTIRDLEKTRKLAMRLGRADETNGHYAGQINAVIDQMTEGAGGKLYQEARQLFKEHAAEFKNQGAISKLLGTKPGTTDRRVAFEDVFHHSVLGGSMDDTASILKSLEQAGPKGKQAVAELKGETMKYLQDQASKNASKDVNGNTVLSYAKLNNAVRELEIDGKLDLLFGKKGAQQIRDITETIADLNVAPPGAVNTSTTASVLMEALGAALTGRLPTATVKTVEGIKKAAGDYTTLRKAREALAAPDAPAVRGQRSSGQVH